MTRTMKQNNLQIRHPDTELLSTANHSAKLPITLSAVFVFSVRFTKRVQKCQCDIPLRVFARDCCSTDASRSLGNLSRFDVCTYVRSVARCARASEPCQSIQNDSHEYSAVAAWALGPLRSSTQNTKKGGRLGEVVAYEKDAWYHGHVVA